MPAGRLNVRWTSTGILVSFADGGQEIDPWDGCLSYYDEKPSVKKWLKKPSELWRKRMRK
jgi:hypothetical protein